MSGRAARSLLLPDATRETLREGIETGGHDGEDGRSLRYLHWTRDDDPEDDTYQVDFVVLAREPGQPTRALHELHTEGSSPRRPGAGCSRRRVWRSSSTAFPTPTRASTRSSPRRRPA